MKWGDDKGPERLLQGVNHIASKAAQTPGRLVKTRDLSTARALDRPARGTSAPLLPRQLAPGSAKLCFGAQCVLPCDVCRLRLLWYSVTCSERLFLSTALNGAHSPLSIYLLCFNSDSSTGHQCHKVRDLAPLTVVPQHPE